MWHVACVSCVGARFCCLPSRLVYSSGAVLNVNTEASDSFIHSFIHSFDANNWSTNSIHIGNTVCTRTCSHHQSTSWSIKEATNSMVRISLAHGEQAKARESDKESHQSVAVAVACSAGSSL